jgi:endonuclease YncB( thermonuclease family)
MRFPKRIGFLFIQAVGLIFLLPILAVAELLIGTVSAVHDGDTFTIKTETSQHKVRLAGIDAPELDQPLGVESRDSLRKVVLHKLVLIETVKNDKYGRVIGKVTHDGLDVNLKQIQAGMAWVYKDYVKELSKEDKVLYFKSEVQSKAVGIGLWKDAVVVEPWIWRKK